MGRETGSVGETSIDYFLDSGVAITKMIPQQPSAVLDNFILDVDVLGENDFDTYVLNSVEGEFRDISFRVRHIFYITIECLFLHVFMYMYIVELCFMTLYISTLIVLVWFQV